VADKLAWLFLIMVGGGLLVALIGLLLPIILFCLGFGLAVLVILLLARLLAPLFR
jgi:hypothetical protein